MKYIKIAIFLLLSVALNAQSFRVDTLGAGAVGTQLETGSVVDHSDIFDAGSGNIITIPERTLWNAALQLSDVSDAPVNGSLVPITSNSVFDNLALKQNLLAAYDTAPTNGSSNLTLSQQRRQIIEEIKKNHRLKDEIIDNILNVQNQEEHISLIIDKILFDNTVMLDRIFKNLNDLSDIL